MPIRSTYLLTLLILIGSALNLYGQQKSDSLQARRYLQLFINYEYDDTAKARIYSDSALIFAKKSNSHYLLSQANQSKGWYYQDRSDYPRAKELFLQSLHHAIKANNKQAIADAYGNLGNVHLDLNEHVQSLDYQLKSVHQNEMILASKISEDQRKRALEGKRYAQSNIAQIFRDLDLLEKSLEYERKSLSGEIEAGNKEGEGISYIALALTHKELDHVDSAEYYFKKGIKIFKEEGATAELPEAYYAYASMNGTTLSKERRGEMFNEAFKIDQSNGHPNGMVTGLLGIADYQFKSLSRDSLNSLLGHAQELIASYSLLHHLERFNKISAKCAARFGDFEGAYYHLQEFVKLRKIADKQKKNQEIVTAEVKYEVRLKSEQDSLKLAESFALKREKDQRKIAEQRTWITLGVLGGIVLLGSLSFFVYSNRRRRRLNEFLSEKNSVINNQKNIVEEKNQSISASIAYAQRLQSAILPKRTEIEEYFPESFLIFKPKDLVSGDFYWFETFGDVIYIAAADCTGHGVPGAMVSVVCSNALTRVLKEFGITEPNKILARTRELVMETFGRSDEQVEDGMDISLCAINKTAKKVVFAGANNPLWIVRSNEHLADSAQADRVLNGETHHLLEFKGDKQPVGPYPEMKDFTNREVKYFEGDLLYMFSDGFSDQFGGEADKKFMSGRLKKELLSRCSIELHNQEILIDNLYETWRGDNEQVDDVCMIAVKL